MAGPSRARRVADAPLVWLPVAPAAGRPLHRQLYDALRAAILDGRLPPDARVPSTRALAADLGIARSTVAVAYEQLRLEGYVAGRRGGGTRVCATIPDRALRVDAPARRRGAARPTPPPDAAETAAAGAAPRLSARGAALVAAGGPLARAGGRARPFRLGLPATEVFPLERWTRLVARRWRRGDARLAGADPAGEPALRAAVARYVQAARGARCSAAQVLVVGGTQQALDLAARVLLDPGDAAWLEDPGYDGARAALAANGARVIPVPVDAEGLDVAAGERAAGAARLAYVTPSHQFPTGAVMSASRRLALLAWARRAAAWLVEDDYDSEFRYAGRPLPCLQGMDPARVLYVGSFNKTLVPGLRVAYLVVPAALVAPFRAARAAIELHPPTFLQLALADFLDDGHFARHLRRVRALYAERQAALLAAAARTLGDRLALVPDPAGLHLVGWLPPGVHGESVAAAALAEGVEVSPLSRYRAGGAPPPREGLLLSYAGFDARALRAGVRGLARAIDAVR